MSSLLRRLPPLGTLCLGGGAIITIIGFTAYALNYAALNMIGFFYGIPLLLGGVALKITELRPVPLTIPTTSEVEALRATQATDPQKQIFDDLTRYRYGQDAHLDSALKFLGLAPSDDDRPTIVGIREENIDGAYAMILEFDSPFITLQTWQNKIEKMTTFFGPGVRVQVTQPAAETIDLFIIATPAVAATV
ncbi:MAG: DUF2854 domain-containing protein [Plectolyngbya sp. WJT66-NPBG17]|jgi:hypothetical protein|nr:DUF2854 domain-containing protein [Plectolyngbya sp. WJT66-NPBG17]MBW4525840.1 DUF2854 domain-containing protein [Phormidium tanganyikae FI6-MK23]